MKKFLTLLFTIGSVGLLILASCKKEGTLVTTKGGTPSKLTSSTTTVVLDRDMLTDTTHIINFSFTAPQYDFAAASTTSIQIDSVGDNWKNPISVSFSGNTNSLSYNTADFNTALLKIIPGGIASNVNVRVQNSLSSTTNIYSNVISLTVTPFKLAATIYTAGAYEGWSVPSDNMVALVSPTANDIYSGLINFTPGNLEFKVLPDKNDYNGNYGAGTDPGTISQGSGNPPNIVAPGAFYYQVTVDLSKKTIAFVNTWSIIGDATPGGWGSDTDMSYDAATKTWFITALLKSDGTNAVKFRYLHDWGINLGGSGGTLSQNGANITIPATGAAGATYKITLDPVADTYTLVKQ